jgi:hypothetical protein
LRASTSRWAKRMFAFPAGKARSFTRARQRRRRKRSPMSWRKRQAVVASYSKPDAWRQSCFTGSASSASGDPRREPAVLPVQSRHFLERTDCESLRLWGPGFADALVGCEASEGVEPSGEVIGVNKVAQMNSRLIVGLVEVAFDGRILDRAVHPLSLAVIRSEVRRRLAVRPFPKGRRRYSEPIWDRGAGSTKVRAGRP